MDLKLKLFKRDDNRDFRLVQNLTMGEADFNQLLRLRYQLVIAAENFSREENLTPVLIPSLSKDIDEQFRLTHKVIDVGDRSSRKICVTLLRYNVEKPESLFAQFRLFAKKKQDEKFQKIVFVNYIEEVIYMLVVVKSVYDEVITNKPICEVLYNLLATIYCSSFSLFFRVGMSWINGDNRNLIIENGHYRKADKKYVLISRFVQTAPLILCTVTETICTSRIIKPI